MRWLEDTNHSDPYTRLWFLIHDDQVLARVQVFNNGTACYWFEPNSVGKETNSEERAKQLAVQEVQKLMAPVRAPFGINRFKLAGSWFPRFRLFKTPALFYTLFELFRFEDEGFLLFTICLWFRAFQIQISLPKHWIRRDVAHRFPKHQLLSIREPAK